MSTTIDGFQVFRSIGEHPDLFQALRPDVNKAASTLLKKLLKAKSVGIKDFRAVRQVTGDSFDLALDDLSAKELMAIANKLDKHHPQLSTASIQWLGDHLRDLGTSRAEPIEKPVPAPKPPRAASVGKAKLPTRKVAPAFPKSMSAKPSRLRR